MTTYLEKFKNYEHLRLVCIGDSTTTQDWCHPNWIDWLNYTFHETGDWKRAWKRLVINVGKDGAGEKHFINNFKETVIVNKPDVVICSLGLNQLLPEFDAAKCRAETEQLFAMIKALKVDLITWSPYAIPQDKFSTNLQTIRDIYEELSQKYAAIFVDIHSEFLKYNLNKLFTFTNNENTEWEIKELEIDYLHCNVAGNQIIAEKIAREAFDIELLDWEFGTMKLLDLDEYKLSK